MTRVATGQPQPRTEIADLRRLVDDLYRRLRGRNADGEWRETCKFSAPGDFAVDYEGVDTPDKGRLLAQVDLALVTAGSSTTTVTLYKNGVSIGTASLASSDDGPTATHFESVFAPQTDRLGAKVTTKGTGSAGLTINCRFL